MSLFKPLEMDISHLKLGIYGDTGAGKTTSGVLMAIGLAKHLKSEKPVVFFDTERARGWTKTLFDIAGVPVVGPDATRAFTDLRDTLLEAPKVADILLIDSITHPWRELQHAKMEAKRRDRLSMPDWGDLKRQWGKGFSVPFVNSKIHIIWCGRSANVFEDVPEDGDKGNTKLVKTGTKASTEADAGYEPNLLMEMRRVLQQDGGAFTHEAYVIKDRSYLLDGQSAQWDMPRDKGGAALVEKLVKENLPFEFIRPHVEKLNLGSASLGITNKSSAGMFDDQGRTREVKEYNRRKVQLEEIRAELERYYTGSAAVMKKRKGDLVEGITKAMGVQTRDWTAVSENLAPEKVGMLLATIRDLHSLARDELSKCLKSGMKGDKVIEGQETAAVEAVEQISLRLWKGEFNEKVEDDLPFS